MEKDWQGQLEDALLRDQEVRLPAERIIANYLDRYHYLAQMLDELADGDGELGQHGEWLRRELYQHLLAVTLLLSKVDALDAQRLMRLELDAAELRPAPRT